jgi:hypothetical protein
MNPVAAAAILGSLESGVVGATMQTVSTPCLRQAACASPASSGGRSRIKRPSTPAARAAAT